MALELTAGRLADAIHHAQHALEGIEARLDELGLAGTLAPLPEPSTSISASTDGDAKCKGKQDMLALVPDELVQNWSKTQIEELGELRQDLALKTRKHAAFHLGFN